MKSIKIENALLLLTTLLITCCGKDGWQPSSPTSLNSSALSAPTRVTLIPQKQYQFQEGVLTVDKPQHYYSQFAYDFAEETGKLLNTPVFKDK